MLSGRVGTHIINMAIIYIFIIYDIIVDRTRSLFSLSLDNGSYSSDVPRTVFFHRFYTLYEYVFVCDFFFCVCFFRSLCAVEVVSHMYSSTFNYIDAPSK